MGDKGYGNGKSTFRCDHYWRRTSWVERRLGAREGNEKKVMIIDEGRPRNAVTREVHDFLPATELHRVGFGELRRNRLVPITRIIRSGHRGGDHGNRRSVSD